MSLDLCILASGSAGNCTVVRTPAGIMLIDAGIGPRSTARRMEGTGVSLAEVRAICLTHLDRDHFNPNWGATLLKHGIRVFCHHRRVNDLLQLSPRHDLTGVVHPFTDDAFQPLAGVSLRPVALAHDEHGSHGFVIEAANYRAGYATDLGRVTPELIEHFSDLDVLALESNYDPDMQRHSGRPFFLQQRITGGWGHLSNQQAFDAVRAIFSLAARRGGRVPNHVVLLHRSRDCNCPNLLRRLFQADQHIASRLVLAEQFERSSWIRASGQGPMIGDQFPLAFA